MLGKLDDPKKPDPRYGWCEWLGRYHAPADQRGGIKTPGWCHYCGKEWKDSSK